MRHPLALALPTLLGLGLSAQTAPPALTWRGAVWASAATSNRQTPDGSLFLRPMDAPDGSLSLDGLQLGADAPLADGWSLRGTFLAGQDGKVLNTASQQTGSIAYPEALLVWTGARDTLRLGRMNSPIGMESLDHTQDFTASRGLLFSFADPFGQVGVDWHHAFSPAWSADLYVYNGEDQIQDNNQSKSGGLGITCNPGGASDKFVTLMAFTGAEQDGLGPNANTGAEGRRRNRLAMTGQWTWGRATLQWEGEYATEPFPASALAGAQGPGNVKTTFSGCGGIARFQCNDRWAVFARAETVSDSSGERFQGDPTLALQTPPAVHADLRANGFALGAERRWHATFSRLEVRTDRVTPTAPVSSATSLTWSVGSSF